MHEDLRKLWFNSSMARKASPLFFLLPVVLCAAANQTMPLPINTVSPTIRIDRTDFFLGEQVAFEIGKRTTKDVDGPALAETPCELKVLRPDRKEIVQQKGGPGT
jgi:hypothetical protein